MYCATEEADNLIDRKTVCHLTLSRHCLTHFRSQNILRILTMCIKAKWNQLCGDEDDAQSITIKLGVLDYLHEFLDCNFN